MSDHSHSNSCCKETSQGCCKSKTILIGLVIVVTLLVAALLIKAMIHYTTPASLTAERGAFRAKNLSELRAANTEALTSYAYIDQQRGIVRLPIEESMKLTIAEWQKPANGRAALLARQAKASAPLPKAPEKPSAFE